MKIVNSEQMRRLDEITINEYGIPGIVLMENAGISVFHEVLKIYNTYGKGRVFVVCGRGNNGGDGFVVARQLYDTGILVDVGIVCDSSTIKGDARINYDILENLNIPVKEVKDQKDVLDLKNVIDGCGLVVDAILGTGLVREVEGLYKEVIKLINESKKIVISIDIPSGICADTGIIKGIAIKANKTVTLQVPKIGNVNYPGADYCGELVVKKIGIPSVAIDDAHINLELITEEYVRSILPKRKKDTHKGSYGKAYLMAGSKGMSGAALLAGEAVLRTGAGLLKVAIPQDINSIVEMGLTEAITVPLRELNKDDLGIDDIEKIITTMEGMDVIAMGPGCGNQHKLVRLLKYINDMVSSPMVMDADALNAMAMEQKLLNFKSTVVLTPHPSEMSRLTNLDINYINKNRIEVTRKYAETWNAIVLLKGAKTVVAEPGGTTYINSTGNPGMATAGSGDVLTGIITGLIAQGIPPYKAACAGAFIHGLAGDRASSRIGQYGMIAGDIVQELPAVINELTV